ncbi:MAG: SpoIIE family protein phosphatase [Bryobacteraceae bacterium]|nr:SpoIIE family protein phosphatase [Bryobacteraceae bacterium]
MNHRQALRPAAAAAPNLWALLGWPGQSFVLILLALGIAKVLNGPVMLTDLLTIFALLAGAAAAYRLLRVGLRKMIWRLRNRLAVAYLFMAFVPVVLMLLMGGAVTYILAGKMAAYMVNRELDRQVSQLRISIEPVLKIPEVARPAAVARIGNFYAASREGFVVHYRAGGTELRFPEGSKVTAPPDAWREASGLVAREGGFYLWARMAQGDASITASYPLSDESLNALVQGLGSVALTTSLSLEGESSRTRLRSSRTPNEVLAPTQLPPAANALDQLVYLITIAPTRYANWEEPGSAKNVSFVIFSRVSAVLRQLYAQEVEGDLATGILQGIGGLFLIVELIALIIGISLTRSITTAVHDLYDGTERVMEGDFAHRIRAVGRDQIASLSQSFNRMTENLERLLKVAKEKERMEAELEIASEVQQLLYPRSAPHLDSLTMRALCHPARTVSGDFYDYQMLAPGKLALLLGDVAGKGISAALLMATIQSSFRALVREGIDRSKEQADYHWSTARIVSRLNEQVYAMSAPAKYATLFFAIYDEASGELEYTNAGHLPPILIRGSQTEHLGVDGTVVGAFPNVPFGASRLQLHRDDVLVAFTDGVSEPENEYEEMFGEERLVDLVRQQMHRGDQEMMQIVVDAVQKWTGTPEMQDDLTLLIVRKT